MAARNENDFRAEKKYRKEVERSFHIYCDMLDEINGVLGARYTHQEITQTLNYTNAQRYFPHQEIVLAAMKSHPDWFDHSFFISEDID